MKNKDNMKVGIKKNSVETYQSKIVELQKQFDEVQITDRRKYLIKQGLIKKIYTLKFHLLNFENNEAKLNLNKFIKTLKFKGKFSYRKLKPNDLKLYIEFYEQLLANKKLPLALIQIKKIWKAMVKIALTEIKKEFYKNVIFKKTPKVFNKYLLLFDRKINFYTTLINDIPITVNNRYYAKIVNRLDAMAKPEPHHDIIKKELIVQLHNVSKYYANKYLATKVLDNVNLEIEKGEFVVILGPSGSGKTTLLNIISGMDNATYGDVIVAHKSLINKHGSQLTLFRKDNIGFVFQQYGLLPNLTVKENVEIGSYLQSNKDERIDINELLKMIGMYEFRNKFPAELSGGQQQRTSIARSVAKNPNLLFGDEPTAAVDEITSKHILQLFSDINKKYRNTIIIVTHNAKIAEMATKVVKVNNGKIESVTINKKPKTAEEIS